MQGRAVRIPPPRELFGVVRRHWAEGVLVLMLVFGLRSAPPEVKVQATKPVATVAPVAVVEVAPPRAAVARRHLPATDAAGNLTPNKLGAPGAPLENPCLSWERETCARTAMDPFFSALDAVRTRAGPVVVLALGNSLIAGDGVIDVLRARLVASFGAAGRGFLLADRMAAYGSRSRTAAAAQGWIASTFAPPVKLRWPFGLSGVHHTSDRVGAFSQFTLEGEKRAEIFWLDRPEAVPVDVQLDGKKVETLDPAGIAQGRRTVVPLPIGAQRLELIARGKGAVIQGVVLEKDQPGVVLDMLGVPSADASIFLDADAKLFSEQLAARHPSLVILMFGGNETKRIGWGRSTVEQVERDLRALIARTRTASPDAACWVIGPIDSVKPTGPPPFIQRPDLETVIEIERRVAFESGCAFFDLFKAMGGSGSILRFHNQGLMHPDRVHPKGEGLDLLGQLVTDALFAAYAQTPIPP